MEHYSHQWKSRAHKSFTYMLQKNRVKDFREAMIKYLEAMMDSQQQVGYSGGGGGGVGGGGIVFLVQCHESTDCLFFIFIVIVLLY